MNTPRRTILAASLAAFAGWALAMPASAQESTAPAQPATTQGQPQGSNAAGAMPGYGPGMGMRGGMGSGYGTGMRGDCPAMGGGMGPGYGMGPGMGGMGMMGGMSGFGPGAGMGPGMMGPNSGMAHLGLLGLSDAQTDQIENIKTEWKKKQRPLMRQIWEEQDKLNDMTTAEKRDPQAIGKAYSRLSELQRQALEAHIEMENKVSTVLTPEQRTQMRRSFGRGMMGY